LAAAWNLPAKAVQGAVPLPEAIEFEPRGMYVGRNSLKVYDYFLFAQESFVEWVRTMGNAIRSTGSRQPITVGQDEGGILDRLSPAYWGQFVDFTTNHSWWQNDHLLWDSLMAKQPGQAMLIQETGLQRELNLDEVAGRPVLHYGGLADRSATQSRASLGLLRSLDSVCDRRKPDRKAGVAKTCHSPLTPSTNRESLAFLAEVCEGGWKFTRHRAGRSRRTLAQHHAHGGIEAGRGRRNRSRTTMRPSN